MPDRRHLLLYPIFTISGAAGLGYQFVWTKILALALGHEFSSLMGVVTAFFLGLCLGSWAADQPFLRRFGGLRLYAMAEAAIAVSSALAFHMEPLLSTLAHALLGAAPAPLFQWFISFSLPLVLLLPATVAMGATFPAMERHVSHTLPHRGTVAGLYAANTAGAVLGVLASAYVLMPAIGHGAALFLFVLTNMACAGSAWVLARIEGSAAADALLRTRAPLGARAALLLFTTGLLGIGLEVVAVRVLAQVFEGTVYSYAAVLAVYLLGTAAGAACYRHATRSRDSQRVRSLPAGLLVGLALATQLAVATLDGARGAYRASRLALGDSLAAVITSEAMIAALTLALPTLLMGALFSHLVQACRDRDASVGAAVAVNTLGSACAAALFGIAVLPQAGARGALALLGFGYLALLPLLPASSPAPSRRKSWLAGAAAAGVAGLALALAVPGELRIITLRQGEWVVEHQEGVMASVAVIGKGGERNLRVNNRYQMGGTARDAVRLQSRQAHVPLLLHPQPRTALLLGVASGVTLGAATRHADLRIDAVELVPEVIGLLPFFEPHNAAPQRNPRVRLVNADARRFVRAANGSLYDVVIGDLFHPALDGAGALYTREHFTAIRSLLARGGLFCQWLPLYQLDEPTLRTIVATFLEVFPEAAAILADENLEFPALGLVGGMPRLDRTRGSAGDPRLAEHLEGLGLRGRVDWAGTFLADAPRLREYAGDAPIGTDDHPRVIYLAPRFAARRGTLSYGRLPALLADDPAGAYRQGGDARLASHVRSRNLALWGQIAEREGRLDEALGLYRASAALNRDYRPAQERMRLLERHLQRRQSPSSGVQ
ncbi:hypothetical protein [Nitrosovibrio sp. Nv17]|uniref:spermine/spermidine synthase domain-containing protein n=1 Tax=Nitrosovibrio sp. Nv17 TaxID=1855339 RepID=UPI000908ED13|nr:hypothetical protein [Nitrosovibrio sp. Nv17]SFW32571.1 spermidine synthase [Nitrosovibrio sp. Nv17]